MVELRAVRKVYDGRQKVVAVDNIDLTVNRGEMFGLLGPNGAGKTTTISLCTTRALPTAGEVFIGGIDAVKEPARARRYMGVVPQYRTLDRSCNVWENLYFHCRYYGFNHAAARQRSQELLEQFKLAERVKSFPGDLSGGLAQRLEIARAVSHRPEVLFLDEPTASLDPQTRLALWDIIRELRQSGITIVLTTHNMDEADLLCERLAIIDHGKILVCDSPQNLKSSVGAQTIFELRLKDSPADVADRLRALPGIAAVEPTAAGLRLRADGRRDGLLPLIVQASAGHHLRDVSVIEPSLETVFIALTGRELRE
ncbi:MAG TPA: ATP-binding cassette domain-containing protein [Terriglobales bacterium]